MNLSEAVGKYQALKSAGHNKDAATLKSSIAKTVQQNDGNTLVFSNPQEVASLIDVLFDTGQIFSISWVRKTNSSKPEGKKAGEVDVMTIKKPSGYVKGTSNGAKQAKNIIAGRVAVWVCNGKLQDGGFGNWRTPYAKDIVALSFGGAKVGVNIVELNTIQTNSFEDILENA